MSFASRLQNMRRAPMGAVSAPGITDATTTVLAARNRVAGPVASSSQPLGAAEFQEIKPQPSAKAKTGATGKKPQVSAATGKKFIKYQGDIDELDLKIKRLSSVRELYAQGLRQPQDVNILPEKKDVLPAKQKASISKKAVNAAETIPPAAAISAVSELQGITNASDGFKNVMYDGEGLAQSNKNIVVNEEEAALNAIGVSATAGEVAYVATDTSGAGGGLINSLAPGGVASVNTSLEKAAAAPADSPPMEKSSVLFKRSGKRGGK